MSSSENAGFKTFPEALGFYAIHGMFTPNVYGSSLLMLNRLPRRMDNFFYEFPEVNFFIGELIVAADYFSNVLGKLAETELRQERGVGRAQVKELSDLVVRCNFTDPKQLDEFLKRINVFASGSYERPDWLGALMKAKEALAV